MVLLTQGCRFGPFFKAAKPWLHQYLDPTWYDLWRIVSENILGDKSATLLLYEGKVLQLRSWPIQQLHEVQHVLSAFLETQTGPACADADMVTMAQAFCTNGHVSQY